MLWRSHRSSLGSGLGSDLLLYANEEKGEILWDIGEKQRDTIGFSALVATEQGMEEEHTKKEAGARWETNQFPAAAAEGRHGGGRLV